MGALLGNASLVEHYDVVGVAQSRDAMSDYRKRKGKGSGWQPDVAFLQGLSPDQPADQVNQCCQHQELPVDHSLGNVG